MDDIRLPCANVMIPFFLRASRAKEKGDHNMGVDGRCTSTILSRSRCGAREAMTVGCKPTTWAQSTVLASTVLAWRKA